MRRLFFLAVIVLCLISTLLLEATGASAEDDILRAEITSYKVIDLGGADDVTAKNLMAGNSYEITFTIEVGITLGNKTLVLATELERIDQQTDYWDLKNDYRGIHTETWQPGSSSIEFDMVKGNATIALTGRIPNNYTSVNLSNNRKLRFPRTISILRPSIQPDNTILEEQVKTTNVIDQTIDTYQKLLIAKGNLLREAEADLKYEELANGIIERAEELYSYGYVDEANDLLNTIPDSTAGFPVPVEEGSYTIYIVIIALIALILIALLALLLRARSNSSFVLQQVDEEAGKLDVLLVRISRIDKQLARDIEQVKEQLERISGR
ncbi:MAG: hypothetical protein JSV02_03445 [Dehalococcoidia bacterium]|nr:MAG: hypothetical protein JSV02_03445 [Dehalococcoidia bacterium]